MGLTNLRNSIDGKAVIIRLQVSRILRFLVPVFRRSRIFSRLPFSRQMNVNDTINIDWV